MFDQLTVVAAVAANREAILAWAANRGFSAGEEPEVILGNVVSAISKSDGDEARAARLMELAFQWKVDDKLLRHFEVVKKNIPIAHAMRVHRWVIETGIRFPGRIGDLITFMASDNHNRKAQVVGLLDRDASAVVKGESGASGIVTAEDVIANHTHPLLMVKGQPLLDQRRPTFGRRESLPEETS